MEREIFVKPNVDELLFEAAERIIAVAETAIGDKGIFSIALSGGHTPEGLYKLLASKLLLPRIDWKRVHVYFGDERCVPPDSDQSNFRMADQAMLSKLPIPGEQIHRMRGEIDPQEAAKEYGELLKANFGDGGLDMVLLGMGEDGHTASLFPGSSAVSEMKHRCVATFVAKLNAWRITLSAPFINRAANVMILAAGKEKAAKLHEVLEGPSDPEKLPIQLIQPTTGTLIWLLDAAAAGMFDDAE